MSETTGKQDLLVSVVVHARNCADIVESFTTELEQVLSARYNDYEVIFVDDGSADATPQTIEDMLRRHDSLRYLRLSRNFGREVSVYAGMQSAIGDYVVIMSMQTDPPGLIPGMIDRVVRQGGILFGVCERRLDERALFRLVKSVFLVISMRLLRIPLAKNATQFMVFSRQALNAFLEIKDRYRHIRVFTAYIGYTQESFPYQQVNRGGKIAGRSLRDSLGAGVRVIFASSSLPLRLMAWAAVLAALINLALSMFFGSGLGVDAATLPSAFMFFMLATVLAVQAEYITTLTEETRNRPLYYVHEEKNSSVLLAARGRKNVTG